MSWTRKGKLTIPLFLFFCSPSIQVFSQSVTPRPATLTLDTQIIDFGISLDTSYFYISENPNHFLHLQLTTEYLLNRVAFYAPFGSSLRSKGILYFIGLGARWRLKSWHNKNEVTSLYIQSDVTSWKYLSRPSTQRITYCLGIRNVDIAEDVLLFLETGVISTSNIHIDHSQLNYVINVGFGFYGSENFLLYSSLTGFNIRYFIE